EADTEINKQAKINYDCEQLQDIILKAAHRNIHSKMVRYSKDEYKKNIERSPLFTDTKNLKRIVRVAKKNKEKPVKPIDQLLYDIQIQIINEKHEMQI